MAPHYVLVRGNTIRPWHKVMNSCAAVQKTCTILRLPVYKPKQLV